MEIHAFNEEDIPLLQNHIKQAPLPNFYNRYVAMACWLESRPLQLLEADTFTILFSAGEQVEAMMPAGSYTREALQEAIQKIREASPANEFIMYGLDDYSVEQVDRSAVFDMQVSYVLDAKTIERLENKKLRNAVKKLERESVHAEDLQAKHKAQAHALTAKWALKTKNADTGFHKNLFEEFLENDKDPGKGFMLYRGEEPIGIIYIAQDGARPDYANILLSTASKEINGVSEYLLHLAAEHAVKEWDTKYLNYGGTHPLEDPGLHSFKKKFGWDHILMEYSLHYPSLAEAHKA